MERQPAPNFTTPFLVSLAPLVFIALFVIWALAGLLSVMGVSYLADKGITRIGRLKT
ncbi:hypothetical protein [Palleronia abyssalis]|uniref:Uncharacterized protein n=1 Tax=Palleronia abyssalis TaxID=1501240 RepID=A0A2R8BUE8_9RHOB|nr:hypothetical protein [Palleronia abyssalis]SPJ23789.1 hypothetical protein PAA8504_01604 [Palleronia abyssalis]